MSTHPQKSRHLHLLKVKKGKSPIEFRHFERIADPTSVGANVARNLPRICTYARHLLLSNDQHRYSCSGDFSCRRNDGFDVAFLRVLTLRSVVDSPRRYPLSFSRYIPPAASHSHPPRWSHCMVPSWSLPPHLLHLLL